MKLLHVIHSANPAGGGPIEGIKQLSVPLRSAGNTVEVATLDAPSALWLHDFPLPLHPLGPGIGSYALTHRLISWLRKNAGMYDAVIVNGIWQYHSFATWRALRKSSTPYVVFTHGMLDPWFKHHYPFKHIKKWLYWPWGEYRVLRDAAAVLFTCEEERLLAGQSFWLYRCNEVVVKYGTAGPTEDPDVQIKGFLGRYPQLRGKRLALFLGRIHPKKGCDLLIEAFARVFSHNSDWHLVIAGPDACWQADLQRLALRKGVADRITWAGMLNGDLKWGALRAAEIFVLPSHQENFGIVVAEALACGVPVLISNKVNIWREIVADGAGCVAEDDLDGTSSLLHSWMETPEEMKRQMRLKARECFATHFEIHAAAASLIHAIESVKLQ
jgi:glycosyltransferase involved in cell wall biosynthesis